MKAILILFLATFISACGSNKINGAIDTETIINIGDQSDYFRDDLLHKMGFHKDKEIKIYILPFKFEENNKPRYALYIYSKEKGRIGNFVFWGYYKYEKASCKWANDSTLHFKLYNSKDNFFDNYTYTLKNNGEELGMDRN